MTQQYVLQLFDYDLWANHQIRKALLALPPSADVQPLNRLFSHIIGAQQIWLARIQHNTQEEYKVWPEIDSDDWSALLEKNHSAWRVVCETRGAGFKDIITYQNTKGTAFETPLQDILTHVVIHGQHHRAQIAMQLRALGFPPPPTDFIAYTR